MGGLSICMPFTSSCLVVSNFALYGMPFLSGVYSRDFILQMFSMRYVNTFGSVEITTYEAQMSVKYLSNRSWCP